MGLFKSSENGKKVESGLSLLQGLGILAIIGIVALLFTAVGMHMGRFLGCRTRLGQYAEVLGGIVLMGIGGKILWQGL